MRKCIIDGLVIPDKEALHSTLRTMLTFSDDYGNNLDALYDLLTEPSDETEITLSHIGALSDNLGSYSIHLIKVLCDATKENPHLTIVILED